MWRIHINLTYFPQHIPVFVNAHVPLFLGVYRKIEKHNNAYIVYFVTHLTSKTQLLASAVLSYGKHTAFTPN